MLIYMGDYTDDVLDRCGIQEVTEECLGFVEMQARSPPHRLHIASTSPFDRLLVAC